MAGTIEAITEAITEAAGTPIRTRVRHALQVLAALGHTGQSVSQVTARHRRYASSGEVNQP